MAENKRDYYEVLGVSKGASAVGYSYASDLLSAISTASGTDYSFAYGAFDLVQSIQAGSRTLISHSYSTDGNHQLTRSDYGNGDSVSYGYDSLGRTTSVRYEDGAQVDYTYDNNGNLGLLTDSASGRRTQYFYDFQDRLMRWEQSGSGYANSVTWGYDDNNNLSTQKQTLNGTTYTTNYTYDKDNRLTKTTEGTVSAGYTYDALGQLIQVNDHSDTRSGENGTTWKYTYDLGGNILKKERFAYADTTNPLETVTYTYGDANWRDKLTAVNGSTIRYDAIGNPLNDGTWTYTWQNGRQLQKMQKSGVTAEFVYNADELRVQKTVNGVATKYTLHGKNIVHITSGTDELHFFYDAQNRPAVVVYNGTAYAYVKSLQGDIVAILDENGNTVDSYGYDAWGAPLWCTGELAETLGKVQPFRYRGYVFDEETGLYYLRSRYYNPQWGRFVNADALLVGAEKPVLNHSCYIYCTNDPVKNADPDGEFLNCIIGAVVGAVSGAITAAINGDNVAAGALVGALSGAAAGFAVDAAVATGGILGIAICSMGGGLASLLSDISNDCINGREINWKVAAVDAVWGAITNLGCFLLSGGTLKKVPGKLFPKIAENAAASLWKHSARQVERHIARRNIPLLAKWLAKSLTEEVGISTVTTIAGTAASKQTQRTFAIE